MSCHIPKVKDCRTKDLRRGIAISPILAVGINGVYRLHVQTVIQMEGFRSLAEGELVEFEAKPSDRGFEATFVCGPGGTDCKGSERRPVGKRKTRKIRLVDTEA